MKVELKSTFAGPNVFWASGSVQEVEEKLGRSLIEAGYAVAVIAEGEAASPETKAPTKAIKKRSTRKRKSAAK